MYRSRLVAGAVVGAAGLAILSGCSLPQGPPGTVVDKERKWSSATKANAFYLTVRKANGRRTTFQVHVSDYDRCRQGDRYPECAHR
ncbi:hypothetical protein AB0L49_10620 [Streptomyces antimycoticus]|uniref:hypothetical protein n=1 Tax=Streptomyces antimycoticus TaxID=68175 RepID=UPI0034475165